MVVVWWCLVDRSSDGWDVDVYDFLRVAVEDGREVEGVGVLAIVDVWAVVHQCLLKPNFVAKSLVEANCPGCRGTISGSVEAGAVFGYSRSQYTLCISSFDIPLITHCSMTFGSFRTICSTIWRSSIVI